MLRMFRALATLLCAAALTSVSAANAEDVAPTSRVTRGVIVRAAPSTTSQVVGRLAPGGFAELLDDRPGWYRVRLATGVVGFVSKAWTDTVAPRSSGLAASRVGAFRIHAIDVGTGLAVFVEGPGFTMLYDGGSQDDLADGPDNRILAYLRLVRPDLTAIDHLVLSHPHKDHLELLPDVFDRYVVRNVWNSGAVNPTLGYCRFLRKVEAETGVSYHDAVSSSGAYEVTFDNRRCSGVVRVRRAAMMTAAPVPLGPGAAMTVLHRDAGRRSDPNANSVVVRLDLGGRRVLFMGDAEGGDRETLDTPPGATSVEGLLLANARADLRADVLVVGHHGSLTSSRRIFLDAVGATVFIVSSGPHAYHGVQLPDEDVMTELRSRGLVFSTKEGDEQCLLAPAKVGVDADESPGGCTNLLVTIDGGRLTAGPGRRSD